MNSKDIEFEIMDGKSGLLLIDILEVEPKCSFCGDKITEDNFGGILNKPNRVCCKDILCKIKAYNPKPTLKYPENEFPNYNIYDILKMLNRHKNRKITDKFIEQIQWEMKS